MSSTSDLPPTMRAWRHALPGHPAVVLSLTDGIPIPELHDPKDVLVRVAYASLNPGGSIMMQLFPAFVQKWPATPEMDFSGVIAAIGSAVSEDLKIGSRVFGSITVPQHLKTGTGALAEYISVSSTSVVHAPKDAGLDGLAGLPIAGSTALVLMERANLKPGERVLINGASGGIGSIVVQMAKEAVGPEGQVVAICSGNNRDAVLALGADEVVDYTVHSPVSKYLAATYAFTKFDSVIDAFGIQDIYTHSADYLTPGKPCVTVGVAFDSFTTKSLLYSVWAMLKNSLVPRWLGGPPRPYVSVTGVATTEKMRVLATMVAEGKLKVLIDSTVPMPYVLEGYEKILSRRAKGKIIVKVQDI